MSYSSTAQVGVLGLYTASGLRKGASIFCPQLRQMLTDYQSSFTARLSKKSNKLLQH